MLVDERTISTLHMHVHLNTARQNFRNRSIWNKMSTASNSISYFILNFSFDNKTFATFATSASLINKGVALRKALIKPSVISLSIFIP